MENPEFFFRNNINSMHLICLVHQLLMSDLSKAEFSPFEREWYNQSPGSFQQSQTYKEDQ